MEGREYVVLPASEESWVGSSFAEVRQANTSGGGANVDRVCSQMGLHDFLYCVPVVLHAVVGCGCDDQAVFYSRCFEVRDLDAAERRYARPILSGYPILPHPLRTVRATVSSILYG